MTTFSAKNPFDYLKELTGADKVKAPDEAAEASDLVTLDYNARPTLIPRASTLVVGLIAYVVMYLSLARMWLDVRDLQFGLMVLSLFVAWGFNWARNCLMPNQIRVTEKGIGLGWSNLVFNNIAAPIIPWSSISKANFETGSAFQESIEGSFLLTVNNLPPVAPFEYPYDLLSAKLWKMKARSFDYQFRILVSGIAHKADREFLARSLVQNLPKGSVDLDVLRSLDPRYPLIVESQNAFSTSITYLDELRKHYAGKNTLDEENLANVAELNQFLPNMARLLPRSIMQEKLRDSLGLKPDEVLDGHVQQTKEQIVAQSAGQKSKPDTVLDYKPLRLLRPMLDAVDRSGSLTFFFLSLPIIVLGVTLSMFELHGFVPIILCLIFGVPLLLLAFSLSNPAQVTMTESGLHLTWRRGFFKFSCPGIPWSNISFVSYTKPAESWALNTTIDFHVQADSMAIEQRLFYFSFFQHCLSTSNHLRITLIDSGILYGPQAKLFYEGLLRHLPPERIDPLLIDRLCPRTESSFTSLWLTSLTKERVRTEPLDPDDIIGDGRYKVIKQIGAGGKGIAYQALCLEGGSEAAELVVLKEFIIPSHAGQSAQAKALESVHRECEMLQNINHPYVVKMKDNFIEDHRFYLVLEHAEGESLRKLVNENGPLSNLETMELAVQLLGILAHLHTMSPPVIHRDFTPENIIIAEDGTPKLIDFNVARQSESTATRTVVGKHSYLPPEQFRGKASPQSDIYALGASLFFALTGEDPEPISASRPRAKSLSVANKLDDVIFRATQLSTDDRYKSADEMKEDLLSQVPLFSGA